MPKRILLADDSITIQKVVELTFSDGDYEVVAVNNGAKAIAKLSEMRPDVILSDIIMPEKNGYEVCEYVKSHPEFRNIPVVLLTGTFEPFDPDRADKAGCDAVVTKPFESQSLIHKVEELIEQSRSNASAATTTPAPVPPAPSPWDESPAAAPADSSPFSQQSAFSPPPAPLVTAAFHPLSNDIFGSAPMTPAPESGLPFAPSEPASPFAPAASAPSPALGEETRASAPTSLDDGRPAPNAQPSTPEPQPDQISPWDEPPMPVEETRAFPRMSFQDLQQMASEPAVANAPPSSPWNEAPAAGHDAFAPLPGDAPAAGEHAPSQEDVPGTSPWDEPAPLQGETRAFPRMSFDELQQMAGTSPAAENSASTAPSPWNEPAADVTPEIHAPVHFDEAPQSGSGADPVTAPQPAWNEPSPATDSWSSSAGATAPERQDASHVASPFESQSHDHSPFESESHASEESAPAMHAAEPASWSPAHEASPSEPAAPAAATAAPGQLTDEQVDRIARRVVELMSDQVIRNIAWEVIPDMAEMAVKERIRQLEAEA